MPDTAVALMAKFPAMGMVKTRLARKIGKEAALVVYNKLLDNAVQVINRLDKLRYLACVFVTPAEKTNEFAKLFSRVDHYFHQEGDDLGLRMSNAIEVLLSQKNIRQAILIGADIPEISGEILIKARDILNDSDIVLGPTIDGGYYLIGMGRTIPELFKGPVWGANTVLEKTNHLAQENGISVGLLPTLRDLDKESDLEYFKKYVG